MQQFERLMGKDTAKREAMEKEFIIETGFLLFFLFCNYCELEDARKSGNHIFFKKKKKIFFFRKRT